MTIWLGRSLHWERGLKLFPQELVDFIAESLPSLGAWIETLSSTTTTGAPDGRSLHWERGLKLVWVCSLAGFLRRSLHWERGLKPALELNIGMRAKSLPSLGAWIETWPDKLVAHHGTSLPSLGAWIETTGHQSQHADTPVAPFIGSVD